MVCGWVDPRGQYEEFAVDDFLDTHDPLRFYVYNTTVRELTVVKSACIISAKFWRKIDPGLEKMVLEYDCTVEKELDDIRKYC